LSADQVKSAGLTDAGAKLIVSTFAVAFTGLLIAMPKAVAPTELPDLVLPLDAAAAAADADAELAALAPTGPVVTRFLEAYDEQGQAELAVPPQPVAVREARIGRMRRDLEQIASTHGEQAIGALRAAAAARVDPVAHGDEDLEDARRTLGSFVEVIEAYGLYRDGRPFAPPVVFRALYEARWNALAGLPFTEGLQPVEVQAYWGWLAYYGEEAGIERRAEAFRQYVHAGGAPSNEAIATMAYFVGDFPGAARFFWRAHAETGSIRLRNHALAAEAMREP